jgi:hypothetical protein
MKLAAIAFFLLLVTAHCGGDLEEQLAQPLSLFRDGEKIWLGYALFSLLLMVGVLYTVMLARRQMEPEAIVSGFAVLLLLIVAATPSYSAFHLLTSLVLLTVLFGYYGLLLRRANSLWFLPHLMIPVILVLATRFHSYGLWQKSFISYIVLAAVIHTHLLGEIELHPQRKHGGAKRRRKVYRLEPGPEWARKRK